MVVEAVEQYKEMFVKAKRDFEKVVGRKSKASNTRRDLRRLREGPNQR